MINIAEKYTCTGCKACADVCPKSCIRMEKDSEDFFYPRTEIENCINCKLCEHVCPSIVSSKNSVQRVYAGTDSLSSEFSASGGAFWVIAQYLLGKGYHIAGAQWDESLKCIHRISSDRNECTSFRGSKYVQSDTSGLYLSIKNLLSNGKKICVSGTPCQISAVKNFVGDHENLFLIDIICHGVASQSTFDQEISYLENKFKKTVLTYSFKCKEKKNGTINTRRSKVLFADGSYRVFDKWEDPFLRGYYSRLFYRPSCEKCLYATIDRVGDITLGDAWDIEALYPELDSQKGVSLILINTNKGRQCFESISSQMHLVSVSSEWAVAHNECLIHPTLFHPLRSDYYRKSSLPFEKRVNRLTKRPVRECILDLLRRIYHTIKRL